MKNILKKTGKILLYTVCGLVALVLLVLIGVFVAMQFTGVQTWAASKATSWVSKKTGTEVRIARLDIDFVKTVVLEGVYAEDRKGDTLLYAGQIRANIGLLALGGKKIELSEIGLEHVVANISKPAHKDTFNFQFFIDAFAGDTTKPDEPKDTTKTGWEFDVRSVALKDIRFRMDDRYNGNMLLAHLGQLDIDLNTLGLNEKHPKVDLIRLNGLRASFDQSPGNREQAEDSVQAKVDTLADPNAKQPLNPSGWLADLKRLEIRDVHARYDVNGAPENAGHFDYQHLDVQGLALTIDNFALTDNDIKATLAHLAFKEHYTGAEVQEMKAEMVVHEPTYKFTLNEFRTPRSVLDDGIELTIPNLKDAKNFTRTMKFTGRFRGDSVHVADVTPFVPVLDSMVKAGALKLIAVKLDGQLAGHNHMLGAREFTVSLNSQNRVTLSGKVASYDDLPRMKLDEMFHEVEAIPAYIVKAIPIAKLPPEAMKLRRIHYTGKASGTLAGLSGSGTLESAAGRIALERYFYKTDASFKTHTGSARVRADGVQPAVILGPKLGLANVYLTADVDGGYSEKAGPTLRQGHVVVLNARYKGYDYRNLRLDATYLNQVAKAHLRYKDRNLKTDLHALADMGRRMPLLEAHGPIAADLRQLKLTKDTLAFSTRIDARIHGTDPNTMTGYAKLTKTVVEQYYRRAGLDSLLVTLGYDSGRRLVTVQSEVLQAKLVGKYDIARLGDAMTNHIAKYVPLSGLKQVKNLPKQEFTLTAHVPANPLALETAVPGLTIPSPVDLRLDFSNIKEKFDTQLDVPGLKYNAIGIWGMRFTTDTRSTDSVNFRPDVWRVALAAHSINQDSFEIPEPEVKFRIREGDAEFRLKVASEDADNRARIGGNILSIGDITKIRLARTDLRLKKQQWTLDTSARLEFGAEHLVVNDFVLENKEDSSKTIRVDLKEGYKKNALVARVSNIEMNDIIRLLPTDPGYKLEGIIGLRAEVNDVFTMEGVKAHLSLDSIAVNDTRAGRFVADVEQPRKDIVAVLAELNNQGNKLQIKGRYNLEDTAKALDFRLLMEHFQPEEIAPILKAYITKWEGDMSADMTVKGRVKNPRIEGFIRFNDPNVLEPNFTRIPYVLTDQQITFSKNKVRLDNFTILDEVKNSLVLDGDVDITELSAPIIKMKIEGENFHLINTRSADNESFYGSAFITSRLRINGPAKNLEVKGRVETEEGTKITYNLAPTEPGKAGKADWITFVDTRDSTARARMDSSQFEAGEKVAVSGFGLSMRVMLKKGTRFTIIIDPATGDQLQCEGTAELRLRLDPNGEVNLQGQYELTDGFYQMNLLGLVKKRFKVQNGSQLNWTGDPANANIDLTAVYETKTSRFELVADEAEIMSAAEVAAAKRRLPVQVLLNIKNTIMQPEIKFDIKTPEEGEAGGSGVVAARLQQMRSNESEVNKQALGLIAFNRFVSTGETRGSAGGSTSEAVNEKVNQTVGDIMSQQLSGLTQEYLGGVEVNVNVNSNDYAGSPDNREVGVSVSRNFINDRLRVSVGGIVNNATGASNGGSSTPALGDLTAEYRLDKAGNLNIKLFRTYTQALYSTANQERVGGSLSHTKNFSSVRKLFWNKERKEEDREKNRKARLKNMKSTVARDDRAGGSRVDEP